MDDGRKSERNAHKLKVACVNQGDCGVGIATIQHRGRVAHVRSSAHPATLLSPQTTLFLVQPNGSNLISDQLPTPPACTNTISYSLRPPRTDNTVAVCWKCRATFAWETWTYEPAVDQCGLYLSATMARHPTSANLSDRRVQTGAPSLNIRVGPPTSPACYDRLLPHTLIPPARVLSLCRNTPSSYSCTSTAMK